VKKVTGIGGVFFKSKNPAKSKEWYEINLGIKSDKYGHSFKWRDQEYQSTECITQWSPMAEDTDYYHPSKSEFMINYRVDNLEALLLELKRNKVKIIGEMQEFDYGKFAWVIDPDGRKVELWEPKGESTL
jgi:predicted enzyme related to lactoylglutathione lyase